MARDRDDLDHHRPRPHARLLLVHRPDPARAVARRAPCTPELLVSNTILLIRRAPDFIPVVKEAQPGDGRFSPTGLDLTALGAAQAGPGTQRGRTGSALVMGGHSENSPTLSRDAVGFRWKGILRGQRSKKRDADGSAHILSGCDGELDIDVSDHDRWLE